MNNNNTIIESTFIFSTKHITYLISTIVNYKINHNTINRTYTDGSLLVGLLWRLDLWASMRSFNGDFPPRRCNGWQRRRGERRRHPLGNKPWKKELHHQDEPWIRSLERMHQWRKRKRERKREGGARNWRNKRGRVVELWSMSHKTLIHQSYNKCYTCFYL